MKLITFFSAMALSLQAAGPDFLIIGAQKGGTTSMYFYLDQHPSVKMPEKKELHFFDLHYEDGISSYLSQFPKKKKFKRPFITGDATPEYLVHPLIPERAYNAFPKAKLIVLLRNPVDRAFSRYKNHVYLGLTEKSFEECIDECKQTLNPDEFQFEHYLSYGLYEKQLRRWLSFYPKEQMLILISENLFEHTQAQMDIVHSFLGLKPFILPKPKPRYVGKSDLKLNPETRARLEEFYRPYNDDLQRLFDELELGITLPWNNSETSPATNFD